MCLKIGIDYHGVITDNPTFFKNFNGLALQKGCLVYVISGGRKREIEVYLQKHQIPYSDIFSILDFYDAQNQVSYLPDGSFKIDDALWNKAKSDFCLQNNIAFHIDDSPLYGQTFQTPFCLYDQHAKNCSTTGFCIDFTQSPKKVLDNIFQQLSA